MSTNNIDTNVSSFTDEELLTILNNPQSEDEIIESINFYIDKFSNENNKKLVNFFNDVKDRLVPNEEEEQNDADANGDSDTSGLKKSGDSNNNNNNNKLKKQTSRWWNEGTSLNQSDPIQRNKVTDRVNKIDVYDNQHLPMNREQLGVSNNFNVSVAQDGKLNPTLENTTNRFIVLDSAYRQASESGENSQSTDYVCDLSDPLKNVLSLRLFNIQIPYSWYNIDLKYGNTCFWIYNPITPSLYYQIIINSGTYDINSFIQQLEIAILNAGFTGNITYSTTIAPTVAPYIYYSPITGKITFNLNNLTDPSGNVLTSSSSSTESEPSSLVFFDFSGKLKCCYEKNYVYIDDPTGSQTIDCATGNCYTRQNSSFDNSLGWIMGYRGTTASIFSTSEAIVNLYGPRYFTLIIDDLNQNHINNGLITITELDTRLKLPDYYNSDLPYFCTSTSDSYQEFINQGGISPLDVISEKIIGNGKIQQILPQNPINPNQKKITQNQIYTLNEILKNNSKTTRYRPIASNPSDLFAVILLDVNRLQIGQYLIEDGSTLQVNKRNYFGPVNISRLKIKLLDDKGNIVNLNGLDFNFTLIAETLYQY